MSKRKLPSLRANLFRSVALTVFSWATHAYALPTGGTVTGTSGGTVTITTPTPTGMVITSGAHRALIDWTNFSVGSGETVTFNEPDKNAIIVNRQLFGASSYIDGYITSLVNGNVGGNVWIINPNGIVFGAGAHMNVGGMLATTSNLVSDSAFLSGADTDPIDFAFSGNTTSSIIIDHGANIIVHDGTAAFIADKIYDYGSVTGTGAFATDTKAVFATAQNFTLRFGVNPPDPLRSTDLDLFDLSATKGGGSLIMSNGASTTAGQVILDNFADLTALSPGQYSHTYIRGASIDAIGDRGDGFDLTITSGNITGGAPVGGVTSDRTIVTIGPGPAGTPGGNYSTSITSAGGLYISADEVLVNNQAGSYAIFDVVGHSDIVGHLAVDLTDIGSLYTDVHGGSVVIDQHNSYLHLGAVSGSNLTIDGFQGVSIGSIDATGNVSLDATGGLKVGDITAYSLYLGTYGDAVIGNITGTGRIVAIEESGRGNVTTGNITAASGEVYLSDTLSTELAGNMTTGAIDAGQNIIVRDNAGTVSVGALTTPNAYLQSYGTLTIGGGNVTVLNARSGYTGNGSGAVNAADIDITGALYVEDASFIAGGTFRNTAPVTATANGYIIGNNLAGDITILANDVDVQAPIAINDTGNGTGHLYVELSNSLGMNIGDNLYAPSGFQMSAAEFAFLKADHVTLEDASQYSAGVRIGDLTIDAAKTPVVEVGEKYAGGYAQISVEGTISGVGAPSFMIGGPYQEAQKPGNVIVSGAIGTAANPMGYVYLGADLKVVLGSQAYLDEWSNELNPGVFQPGLGGVANGHEWISAANVVLETKYGGTIIEQNTSPTGEGLHITGSLTIAGQPYQVNLFGDLPDGKGGELYGTAAAGSPELYVSGGNASPSWRFNGCQFGGGNCQPLSNNPYGLPYGGTITGTSGGNVTLTYNGPTLTVYSNAHRVIIDWASFSVAAGDTVTFLEPDKNAIVVNRQMFGGASEIYGEIMSLVNGSVGGNVWVINPNGILFGAGTQINVGGFLASTSNLASDSTFLTEADPAPIDFVAAGNGTGGITIASGANINVYDGAAAFIGNSIVDNGNVTGLGQFQTDTKAVFAAAQNFTIRFDSVADDPARATDMVLEDLSATSGGGDITLGYGSTTIAGQVIVDNFAFLSAPGPYSYGATTIVGADIEATGKRGDNFDLMILSGNVTGGAPVGGLYSAKTTVVIGPTGNASGPSNFIYSAGGLYIDGDVVKVDSAGTGTDFEIAGQTLIRANIAAYLTNTGSLAPNVVGGDVVITETQDDLVLGNITSTSIDINANYNVRTGNLDAPTVGIDSGGDVHVGNVTATGDGTGLYIKAFGNVSAGEIDASRVTIDAGSAAGYSLTTGNITAQYDVYLRAGGDITTGAIDPTSVFIQSYDGSISTGDITSSGGVTLLAQDNIGAGAVSAGGTVNMNAYGGGIVVGDTTGALIYLSANNAIHTGNVTAAELNPDVLAISIVSAYGPVVTGNVSGAGIFIRGEQYIDTGDLSSTRNVYVYAENGADAHLGNVSANGAFVLRSTYGYGPSTGNSTFVIGNADAASITIDSYNSVRTGNLSAPTVDVYAGGDVHVGNVVANGDGAGLYISAFGNVTAGVIDASNVTIYAGPGGAAAGVVGSASPNVQTYNGSITTGAITSSGGVTLRAETGIDTGTVSAGGYVQMYAYHGGIRTGDVTGAVVYLYAHDAIQTGNITGTATDPEFTGVSIVSAYGSVATGNVSGAGIFIDGAQSIDTGDLSSTRDIYVYAENHADAQLGNVSATGVFVLQSAYRYGPSAGNSAFVVGNVDAASITIDSGNSVRTGNLDAPSVGVNAGGDVHVGNVIATGYYGSGLYIHALGNVTTLAINASTVTIDAGSGAANTLTTGAITAQYDVSLRAGGDIRTGAIDPSQVDMQSYYGSIATGDITSSGGVYLRAGDNITAGNIVSGDRVRLSAYNGTIGVGDVTASYSVYIAAHGTVTLGGLNAPDAFVGAGSFYPYRTAPADIVITGAVNVGAAEFVATGTFRDLAPITATASGGYVLEGPYFARSGNILIHAGDVDIEAPITVIDAGGTGRITFEADNTQGVNLGDNLSNPSGFQMSNAEFGELKADSVYVLDFSRNVEFRVGDLTIDAAKTPFVGLGAGHYNEEGYYAPQNQTISIEGTIKGVGDPKLAIGTQVAGLYGFKYYNYAPDRVIISGAVGTAANPIGELDVSAISSIIIGSQTFAGEVANGTAPTGWVEGLGGVQDGHEFISAGDVTLYSPGVIVGQDTSPRGDGMHVTGSLTIEGDPTEVNLFGQLPGANGVLLYGTAAASSPDLIVITYGGAAIGPYRFNGCLFGGGDCQPTIDIPITGIVPPLYAPTAGEYAGASPITITANGIDPGPGVGGIGTPFGPIIVAPSAEPLGGDRDDGKDEDQHGKHKKKGGKGRVSGMGNEDHWPEGKH